MTEPPRVVPLEASIEIDAPAETIWALVSDIERMASWSPQVVRSTVAGDGVGLGTTFVNDNRQGDVFWPTHANVVRFDPPRKFAFRIKENRLIWSFELEPLPGGGTRVIERRECPDGISDLSIGFTEVNLGGAEVHREPARRHAGDPRAAEARRRGPVTLAWWASRPRATYRR